MKKLVLILTAIFGISSFASAEGFFIGGGLNTHSNNSKYKYYDSSAKSYGEEITGTDNRYFNFSPTIGYSFNNDWEMSLTFDIDIYKNKLDDEDNYPNKNKGFAVDLSGRRYFELSDRFNWYVDANLYFEKTTEENFYKNWEGHKDGDADNNKYFGIYIVPGIEFEINDHWSLDMDFDFIGLSYGINKYEDEDEDGNPYNSKGTNKYFNFHGTTAPGTIHDLTESISLSLYYSF